MKVVASLACRNNSTRLYGKPLQRLGQLTVLEYIINNLRNTKGIDDIVLAISEAPGNEVFQDFALKHGVSYIFGDDKDVLMRLINACQFAGGDTVFRLTTESPFTYLEGFSHALESHVKNQAEYTAYSGLPDGSGFEILNLASLKRAHHEGTSKYRSEYCSLYMYENQDKFKFNVLKAPEKHQRPNYRLTIDYPEDLILCRKITRALGEEGYLEFDKLIPFLDENPELRKIVENLTDENYIIYKY